MRATGGDKSLAHGDPLVRVRTLVVAPSIVLGLVATPAFAQSSAVLSVTARVVAACTITSSNPQSTCPEQILASQSDITNASARISTSDTETVITHKGGLPPRIEKKGNQVSVSF